jgi:tRNA C32,U32 (ribose-2'-O)-methylase TrmJ
MPEQDLIHLMMNGGSNVAFGVFLYWQYMEQRKRADEREAKQEAREKELRDRYDKVIADLQAREDAMRTEIVKEITDLDKRMSLLEQKLDIVSKIVEDIKARFQRVV